MTLRPTLLAAVCVAAVLIGGCTGTLAEPVAGPAPEQGATAPASAVELKAMTIEQKQQLIAENVQPEVPVPFGEVVRGNAQGENAWDYELVVAAPPESVASWYREAYTGREWQVAEQTAPAQGAITLTLVKNAAQTRVVITPEGGDRSRVAGVLGVGAPVLQTQ